MTETTFAVLSLLVLVWAVTSDLLAKWNITGPLVFSVAGYVLGNPDWGVLSLDVDAPSIHLLAEVSLALLLFSDAARVNVTKLRRDISLPGRLLGIGLPLSIISGSLIAAWLFDDLSWALAGFVGATLAPTDAALSAQVINDERIPTRLRRALNVESGLNDGIVTPIVVFMLAVSASELGVVGHGEPADGGDALIDLATGLAIGLAIGVVSAVLISFGSRRGWIIRGGRRLSALAAALSSFALAIAIGGNGFIAAFVAGISFGAMLDSDRIDLEEVGELPEFLGELLALGVWFLFGVALVPTAFHNFDASVLIYALLSLTLIRMIPVAIAMSGTGQERRTILFVGWFGPRGLASVVFALLAVEELGHNELVGRTVGAVSLTVLLSVVLHGVTAGPLGRRYAHLEDREEESSEGPRSR